jgi:hypothetical protein
MKLAYESGIVARQLRRVPAGNRGGVTLELGFHDPADSWIDTFPVDCLTWVLPFLCHSSLCHPIRFCPPAFFRLRQREIQDYSIGRFGRPTRLSDAVHYLGFRLKPQSFVPATRMVGPVWLLCRRSIAGMKSAGLSRIHPSLPPDQE